MTLAGIAIKEIYRLIPGIDCQGLCYIDCGKVMASPAELARISEQTGSPALLLDATDPATADSILNRLDHPVPCPYLKDKRCTIYPVRPAICRLYGVAEGLTCPFGCKRHERLLTDAQSGLILAALEEVPP